MERKTFDDDLNLDDPLEKLNSNLMWKTKQKQELKNRIIYRIETLEVKAVGEENIRLIRLEKRFSIKKVIYTGIALTLLIGLFIGSAFISPAMAKVATKILYLNKIFQSEPINQTIWNELEEKGYHISGSAGVPVKS